MSELSNYAENQAINFLMNTESVTRPTTWYFALFSAAPNDAGGGTELAGDGYSRQAVTFGAASSRAVSNTNAIDFTPSGDDWPEVTHFAVFDASTDGNMLVYSPLDSNLTPLDGVTYRVAVGNLGVVSPSVNLSDHAANLVLDWMFTTGTATRPTEWHVSFHESDDTELVGNGYTREPTDWDAASGGATANSDALTFGPATGSDWETVTQFGVYDAATTGNRLWLADLNVSRTVTVGATSPASIGDFTVALD